MNHSDEWIEDRIRFRASKFNLPMGNSHYFEDVPTAVRDVISGTISSIDSGKPVLLAFASQTRWSLIATRSFVGTSEGAVQNIRFGNIAEMRPRDYPPRKFGQMQSAELARLKSSWEYLQCSIVGGGCQNLWVPPGPEAFAFWNILLMLARMHLK